MSKSEIYGDREIKPLGLSQREVRELFELRDGRLYWQVKHKSISPGDLAGGLQSNGYWRIKIDGRTYKRSRLVWLYVHGMDSYPHLLDHINRDRSDDRIENLRMVTHAENQRNRSWGISRTRYVYREGRSWRARVSTHRGRVSLGRFGTEEDAIAAVQQWESLRG
ncbi:MAG: HNH endonuclease [Planctomycetaceae bacterium]|nr:HNH endonuclease [Planctomycetaceae bacterium]